MNEVLLRRVFPRDRHHVDGLHWLLRRYLPDRGQVLDLGCGANSDLAPYRESNREVWGADFQAHPDLQHPQWFRPLCNNGEIPFPDRYFDTVVAVMVVEHVIEPELFLAEVSRVLKPGGVFIAHSISGSHYVTLIRRLFGLLPHSVNQKIVKRLYRREENDTFPAYYRMNHRSTLERLAKAAGLSPAAFERYADPGYFRFSRPLQAMAIIADKLLDQLHAGWGRLYFTFAARKSERVVRAV